MKERPITLDDAEVRAVLAGRKTQLRVPIPYGIEDWYAGQVPGYFRVHGIPGKDEDAGRAAYLNADQLAGYCPYQGRLWVREVFATVPNSGGCEKYGAGFDPTRSEASQYREGKVYDTEGYRYRATWDRSNSARWRSPATMPRKASRLVLEVASVRVERLQALQCSEDDAIAEGLTVVQDAPDHVAFNSTYGWDGVQTNRAAWAAFARVWMARYPDAVRDFTPGIPAHRYAWERNPYVWVVTFQVVEVAAGLREPAYVRCRLPKEGWPWKRQLLSARG